MIELSTERLFLRPFKKQDASNLFLLNSDPEVLKYSGDQPFASIFDAENFIRKYDHYQRYGLGRLAVCKKDTGEWVGWCGLKNVPDRGEVNLGYRFSRNYWGNGFATEAGKACLDFGFKIKHIPEIVGNTMPANLASVRVLTKLGMSFRNSFFRKSCEWHQYSCTPKP